MQQARNNRNIKPVYHKKSVGVLSVLIAPVAAQQGNVDGAGPALHLLWCPDLKEEKKGTKSSRYRNLKTQRI
jgi:hypothetical protein